MKLAPILPYITKNTLPTGFCIATSSMWIYMQGNDLLLNGQDYICHRFSSYCLVEDGQH